MSSAPVKKTADTDTDTNTDTDNDERSDLKEGQSHHKNKKGKTHQMEEKLKSGPSKILQMGNHALKKKRKANTLIVNKEKKHKSEKENEDDEDEDNEDDDDEEEENTKDSGPKKKRPRLTDAERKQHKDANTLKFNRKGRRGRSCVMRLWFHEKHCANCGNPDPDVLENDHVHNDKMRVGDLSRTITGLGAVPKQKQAQQFQTCEILCSICHAIRTHERREERRTRKPRASTLAKRAQVDLEKAKIGMCQRCYIPWDRFLSYIFEFDHFDPTSKIRSISEMVCSGKYSWDDVLKEIRKCWLLCRNCHRKRTKEMSILSGKKWLSLEDFSEEEKAQAKIIIEGNPEKIAALSKNKPVVKVDKKTGKPIKVYASIADAARELDPNPDHFVRVYDAIQRCLRGIKKEYMNYLWQRPSAEQLKELAEKAESKFSAVAAVSSRPLLIKGLKKSINRKYVVKVDPETGEVLDIFPSISEAAAIMGCCHEAIAGCIRGAWKTALGFIWEEAHPDHLFLLEGFIPIVNRKTELSSQKGNNTEKSVESKVSSSKKARSTQKSETIVSSTHKAETRVSSTQKAQTRVSSTQKAQTRVSSTHKAQTKISSTHKAQTKISSTHNAETKISSTNNAETKVSSNKLEKVSSSTETIITSIKKVETNTSSENTWETELRAMFPMEVNPPSSMSAVHRNAEPESNSASEHTTIKKNSRPKLGLIPLSDDVPFPFSSKQKY